MNYIGSKYSILDYLGDVVNDFVDDISRPLTLCDIFSGTGSVGKYFKQKGYNIISNDLQYYSYVTAKHFIENNEDITFDLLKQNGVDDPFGFLNSISGVKGFIYNNYCLGGTTGKEFERLYYSDENALKIDAIRQKIEEWKKADFLTDNEYYFLLASLIESADKVANTASVYEAFLKKLKGTASKEMILAPVDILKVRPSGEYKVYNEDCNSLINHISGDILYMDPPYNTRKYDSNYHMLETIALYDNPKIKGKTGVRAETTKKSKYSSKKDAASAFEDLVKRSKFRYLLLSYNDEGIIPIDEIERIMSKYGTYKCYEKQHRRFKADNKRNYLKDYTIEYVHCLRKA